jgi:hypothetical protein
MGNMSQGVVGDRQPHMPFTFSAGSLSQAATGTLLPAGITGATQRVMPSRGSVYGLMGSYSAALTAGTVTLTPVINGVPIVDVQVSNNAESAKGVYGIKPARIANFQEGDTLSIVYSTSGLNAAGIGIICDALCVFEDIEI